MLMNYVQLETDVPLLLHFTDHYRVTRAITDPDTGKPKWVESLVFQVDEVGRSIDEVGEEVAATAYRRVGEFVMVRTSKTFSIVSTKLANLLDGYLEGWRYRKYDFRITKSGVDRAAQFSVEALPRAGAEAVG